MIRIPEPVARKVAKGTRRPYLEQVDSRPQVGVVGGKVEGGGTEEQGISQRPRTLDDRHEVERREA